MSYQLPIWVIADQVILAAQQSSQANRQFARITVDAKVDETDAPRERDPVPPYHGPPPPIREPEFIGVGERPPVFRR